MRLRGIFVCLTTPFDHLGSIYVAKVLHNIGLYDSTAVSGYVVGAAEGEAALLSHEERVALWKTSASAGTEKIIVPAVDAPSVHETLELIGRASDMGFEIALLQVPSGSDQELAHAETQALFVRAVADHSPLPLIVSGERHPGGPGGRLSPERLASLGEHPRVTGLRVVTDDADYFGACLQASRCNADVIAGCASLLAQGLTEGASAAMTAFSAVAPYLCLSIEEAVRTREFDAAKDLQGVALPAIHTIRKFGIPGLKAAADLQGYYGGVPRLPLTPLGPEAKAEIAEVLWSIRS